MWKRSGFGSQDGGVFVIAKKTWQHLKTCADVAEKTQSVRRPLADLWAIVGQKWEKQLANKLNVEKVG